MNLLRNQLRQQLVGWWTKPGNSASMSTASAPRLLTGKVAVVTASTEGIGFAVAKRLAEDGAAVVISSRKQQNVEQAVDRLKSAGLNATGTVCHVGKTEDRQKLIDFALKTNGGIDILVSNAGINPVMGHVLDTPESAWDKIFEVNVKSAFLISKEILPHLRRGGSIIYISSIAGYQPITAIGAYSVSKTALLGLTKAVAIQCSDNNIRVNCVCPGIIETKFSDVLISQGIEEIKRSTLLRRPGKVEEISGVVSFLASDDASYITGESFVVAGGHYSRL